VPDERRIEDLGGAAAEGSVVDRIHSGADRSDGIADHDHSVPDPDPCGHLEPVSWPGWRPAWPMYALGLDCRWQAQLSRA
jgi:hypothetical protein